MGDEGKMFAIGMTSHTHVSIRAPAKGAFVVERSNNNANAFQSTHKNVRRPVVTLDPTPSLVSIRASHRMRHVIGICIKSAVVVSIRAPAWGATRAHVQHARARTVSIRAPAWGATAGRLVQLGMISQFQSAHPHGVRRCLPQLMSQASLFQSAHPHGVRLR